MRQPEHVSIRGVGLVRGGGYGQAVPLAVRDHFAATAKVLQEGWVAPRSVHLDVRREHLRRYVGSGLGRCRAQWPPCAITWMPRS